MHQRILSRIKNELSGDEKAQLIGMEKSLKYSVLNSMTNLQFPCDYVLIYPFYKIFGKNKWGLALPHIFITLVGFYLLYILCRKYFKTIWGYLVIISLREIVEVNIY